ncbi:phosphopantetheine adenylyltransferase [Candidatus Photodesmus katoptron]|uniref:pantetheine-phosphate adenylyltransferase n=1 Tax=Candidatus Photodesmus anomalopis TaxID=28176 RepID=UPI0004D9C5B2|nr:pantetheine-phosphate adenylyltransferase [Candidatus Photodesmus katoptron]KEY90320.1 phosphopantetheine adenylyltransferase [Candidatus Photodesmus katoptron]
MSKNQLSRVIYPGTFDPITKGHLDIVKRASDMFDEVIIAVASNPSKNTMFTLDERVHLIQEATKSFTNLSLKGFSGFIIDFIKQERVNILLRGLRGVVDFEYESNLINVYRYFIPEIEGIFLSASKQYTCISSTVVREIAIHGGEVYAFVPKVVAIALDSKFKKNKHLSR